MAKRKRKEEAPLFKNEGEQSLPPPKKVKPKVKSPGGKKLPNVTASSPLSADSVGEPGKTKRKALTQTSLPDAAVVPPVKKPETKVSSLKAKLATVLPHISMGKPPHLIVNAKAGTGKTTTGIGGMKLVMGIDPGFVPSPQQRDIWDQIALSKGVKSLAFTAYNTSIADELKQKVPPGAQAMTTHSLGNRAVFKAFGSMTLNKRRTAEITANLLGGEVHNLQATRPVVMRAVQELVSLAKVNLIGFPKEEDGCTLEEIYSTTGYTFDPEYVTPQELRVLADYYEVDLTETTRVGKEVIPGADYSEEILSLVPKVLEESLKANQTRQMDYDDMLWLPLALNLPVFRYDLLLVDEAQDLNRARQALVRKAGSRIVLLGDPRQAIYGFTGADTKSMGRMKEALQNTMAGCLELPLTVTYRCGKAIVKEANTLVPDFQAHENNGEGLVRSALYPIDRKGREVPVEHTYLPMVREGDFILCRVNAPLVRECFRLIKRGLRAFVMGREIGTQLVRTIEKMEATNIVELVGRLDEWRQLEIAKERAKQQPNESKIINLEDRYECILILTEGQTSVAGVIQRINTIFSDQSKGEGVKLSSIHKAKGLEAKRVFLLRPWNAKIPHPAAKSAWQIEQEYNLLYVAITRAIEELVYVV